MIKCGFRVAVVALSSVLAFGCKGGESDTDKRLKNLEQELANTQTQLSEKTAQAEQAAQEAQAQRDADAARQAEAAAAASARSKTAAAATAANRADAKKVVDQQRAVNAAQTETNQHIQKQVEQLKPREVTVPAGTALAIRTTSELTTDKATDGSVFDALLEHDLKAGDVTIAKAGSRVNGIVVTSDKGGRVKGTASLIVSVRSIVGVKGTTIAVQTDQQTAEADSTKKKDAVRTGIATGVGAVVGGIVGGGKGAAIGAGTGAAAGVGVNAATRGKAAVIAAESLLEFHLSAPLTVTVHP